MNKAEWTKLQKTFAAVVYGGHIAREERHGLNAEFRKGLQVEMVKAQEDPKDREDVIAFLGIWNHNMTDLKTEASYTNAFRMSESLRHNR